MFDSRHVAQMRDLLRKKQKDGPTHVRRAEVERVGGGNMGLDPVEAARLFQSLKGAYWRGDYLVSNERGWIAAWVESAR
jgi:hypothetical protein